MQAHLSWQRSDDKDANQNSTSPHHQAVSSLTNISYIHHISSHIISHIFFLLCLLFSLLQSLLVN
ncbi:hypothetical protein Bca101_015594 [Brassica carinata]